MPRTPNASRSRCHMGGMALTDSTALGMSLPHRAADPLSPAVVRQVAQRAEALGFQDLWVSNNTVDRSECFDSLTVLAWAAAVTSRIRLGAAVLVLPTNHPIHVAQQFATLDRLSAGRAVLGVGLGRVEEYEPFQVPTSRKVRRFTESVELIRALWSGTPVSYAGEIFQLADVTIGTRPVQRPPIWFGGAHPAALRRAALLADGWVAGGGTSTASFAAAVPALRAALERAGRDPGAFPISMRVFLAVHEHPGTARSELADWFTGVYRSPGVLESAGVCGTAEQVREQLEALVASGATHLLLNPVARFTEQTEMLAHLTRLT